MCLTADSTRSGDCTGAKDQTQGSVEIMPSSRFVAHFSRTPPRSRIFHIASNTAVRAPIAALFKRCDHRFRSRQMELH